MVYAYVDILVFLVSVSKNVMSINGLSFVSARPAPQPCVSVIMVWGNIPLLNGIVFLFPERVLLS